MVRSGQYDEARELFSDRLSKPLSFQLGAYQLRIELLRALFPQGEDHPPQLQDKGAQAWTLSALANSYSLNGPAIPNSECLSCTDRSVEICVRLASPF